MTEDLNFETNGASCYLELAPCCGKLYTWTAAIAACPPGWRLASIEDWESLLKEYGGIGAASFYPLITDGIGGFNATFGGVKRIHGAYHYKNRFGIYWTSTSVNKTTAWNMGFYTGYNQTFKDKDDKKMSNSCRCIKKASSLEQSPNQTIN